jgi:hypothetical protein
LVPEQIVCVADGVTIGIGFTFTESIALPIHPVEVILPIIVYTVVILGFADTTAPVVALRPVEGDQV